MNLRPAWLQLGRRRVSWPLAKQSASISAPPISDEQSNPPGLCVIVICHKMDQQIGNTLRSLVPPYQQKIQPADYHVRVVDNGSPQPLAENIWNQASNIRYEHIPPASANPNPGVAINRAAARTRSPQLCVMIDGARMLSPGVLRWGMDLASLSPRTLVEVRSWHLGSKVQEVSVGEGYNSQIETKLLEQIEWPKAGYRLFEISVPASSCRWGFYGQAGEANCYFLSHAFFDELCGYDERYESPGGGLSNRDFFWRAANVADRVFVVLGEACFHQVHGGAATSLTGQAHRDALQKWRQEYERLSRSRRQRLKYQPILAGHVPPECHRWLQMEPPTD